MRRISIILIVLFLSLSIVSCDIFQLEINDRTNPLDPESPEAVLYILFVSPEDGATGVDNENAEITITFSDALEKSTVTAGDVTLKGIGDSVSGSLTVDGSVVIFSPTGYLSTDTCYTVTVSTSLAGDSGAVLSEEFTYSFTTQGAEWRSLMLLEDDESGTAQASQIAMNDNGVAFAIWRQNDGSSANVYARRYLNHRYHTSFR